MLTVGESQDFSWQRRPRIRRKTDMVLRCGG